MSSLIDLTGHKFGRLTVIKRNATRTKGNIMRIFQNQLLANRKNSNNSR